ncbi:30S ribosomal S1 domain protein [Rickettsia hoogstraalii str. RCCE3]|nr:30S ribosomal S1 domain protein [Rickettsia hoogstraalii str. RCCE3]
MDKKLGNIVVSRRAILEESRSEARDEMLSKIKEGMVLKGTVKTLLITVHLSILEVLTVITFNRYFLGKS